MPNRTPANIGDDERYLGMLFSLGHLRFGSIRAGRRPRKHPDSCRPSTIRAPSRLIVKLGQAFQLFFRCAGKLDFAPCLIENEAVIGNNHQMSANPKEPTDLPPAT